MKKFINLVVTLIVLLVAGSILNGMSKDEIKPTPTPTPTPTHVAEIKEWLEEE